METILAAYGPTLAACVTLALLILAQLLVVDVSQIRARHVPGMPVEGGHERFLFRAVRAHANTNESLGLYLLLVLCALLLSADAFWTAAAAWLFTAARAGHMVFYYADWRIARSLAFGTGLLAQLVLLVLCGLALRQAAA